MDLLIFDNILLQAFLSLATALVIAVTSIPVIINVAKLKHLIDEPNGRSAHKYKTPTLGGISIFAAVIVAFLIWVNPTHLENLHLAMASIVILFFIGIKDDILIISPTKKLVAQILAALIMIIGADFRVSSLFGLMGMYEVPYFVSVVITTFIFIVLINSFNLIDGIDGLAGGIGIIVSFFLGLWFYAVGEYSMVILTAALIGALLGFLRYNFSIRKKIFMGDTGSLIVGFLMAVFLIRFISLNEATNLGSFYVKNAPAIAIAVYIIPLFDTLRVFIIRLLKGRSPFYADKNHIHHILIAGKYSHVEASSILYIVNVVAIVLLFLFFSQTTILPAFITLLTLFAAYFAAFFKKAH